MSGVLAGLLFAAIAGLANIVGGVLILLRKNWSQGALKASLSFSGGFMLAAAIIAMTPESLHLMPETGPFLILAGYLIVHFLEHVLGEHYHFAGDKHGAHRIVSTTVGGAALFAMFVHTFFDGVAIGSAFSVGGGLGLFVFLAVVLHKIPAGFAVSSVALAAGAKPLRAFGASVLMGVGTAVGGLIMFSVEQWAAYAVPLSAGTLIHVAASDLIPEVNEGERWPITIMVVAGGALFLLLNALVGHHIH